MPRDHRHLFLTARFWWRMVAINAAASLLAVFAFTNVSWDTEWRRAGEAFAVSFAMSLCITPFCFVAMASLSPIVARRVAFPLNWAILIATLVFIAVGGTLLGTAILVAVGHVPRSRFWHWFFGALRTSVVLTLVFGIFMTAYELMKDRL